MQRKYMIYINDAEEKQFMRTCKIKINKSENSIFKIKYKNDKRRKLEFEHMKNKFQKKKEKYDTFQYIQRCIYI